MAIYHLRVSVISRGQGRSATAAAAYRVAERITDRRTGLVFDYAAKAGVEHTEILAPVGAPDWVSDRSELWNRVEEAERRKDSRVAREVRVALPSELSHAERVELVRGYVRDQFVDRGMVADVAWHAPGRDGDERNHHAHILLTTRELGALDADGMPSDGFGRKVADWNKVELLQDWREAWARDTNAALERAQVAERVDHRTLVAQREEALELATAARERGDEREELAQTVRAVELDRPPLPQLSPGAWQMKARGHKVGRVAAWHEAKARAAEVREIAAGLAREVGAWIAERAAGIVDQVRERVGPVQDELALAGDDARRGGLSDTQERVSTLRGAWEALQAGRAQTAGIEEAETHATLDAAPLERETAEGLAARLRDAVAGIDPAEVAERAAELRRTREVEERQAGLEAVREREPTHYEHERGHEVEPEGHAERSHDDGLSHGF